MANFHFFTDLHLMDDQVGYGGSGLFGVPYGPVSSGIDNNNPNRYRFCPASMHFAKNNTDNPKAYAICNGKLFFIEVEGTEDSNGVNQLLDAIFLPSDQALVNPNIKYC